MNFPVPSGRIGTCVVRAFLLNLAIILGSNCLVMPARADVSASDTAALQFRHEESASTTQLILGLGFVATLAALAFALKRHLERTGKLPAPAGGRGLRIVQVKRVGPRLSVVQVEINGNHSVVFADNGHALLRLAESKPGSDPEVTATTAESKS